MSDQKEPSVGVADALKILHENCRQNIEFAKNHQWRIANYALLIYAALIGIVRYDWSWNSVTVRLVSLIVATVIGVAAAGFGWYMLCKLQESQSRSRQMLTRVRNHFPKEFHDARGSPPSRFESFWHHGEIYVFLAGVIIVGLIVTLWLLWSLLWSRA